MPDAVTLAEVRVEWLRQLLSARSADLASRAPVSDMAHYIQLILREIVDDPGFGWLLAMYDDLTMWRYDYDVLRVLDSLNPVYLVDMQHVLSRVICSKICLRQARDARGHW